MVFLSKITSSIRDQCDRSLNVAFLPEGNFCHSCCNLLLLRFCSFQLQISVEKLTIRWGGQRNSCPAVSPMSLAQTGRACPSLQEMAVGFEAVLCYSHSLSSSETKLCAARERAAGIIMTQPGSYLSPLCSVAFRRIESSRMRLQ